MDKVLVKLVGFMFLFGAVIYFISQDSISLFDFFWTLLLIQMGCIILFTCNNKKNDAKSKNRVSEEEN